MNSTIAKRCALIGMATIAAGLAMNPASATPTDGGVRSVVVRYSDLDLSRPQDTQVLYSRIKRAAHVVCDDGASGVLDLPRIARREACVQQAMTRATETVQSTQGSKVFYVINSRQTSGS
jgi:UrcA family protein